MFVSYTGRQGSCILLYTTVMGKFAKSPKNLHMLHVPCHVYMSSDTHTCMYILYTRSHNSPKIEHDLQRITTIGYKYIAQHQKKKTKKTQDVIIFIFKLYILNQQKIVHVLLCVLKKTERLLFFCLVSYFQ